MKNEVLISIFNTVQENLQSLANNQARLYERIILNETELEQLSERIRQLEATAR